MKKIKNVIASAIAAAGFAVAAPASAEQYVNVQAAVSDLANYDFYGFDTGVSAVATYGIELPAVHKYFAIEGELTKSIVDPEYNNNFSWWFWDNAYHAELDYYTVAAYAVFAIPVHERITVRARGGVLYNHWTIKQEYRDMPYTPGIILPGTVEYSDSDINPSISGGATFKVNSGLNLMADLTAIDEDSFHISAGAQFRF